MIALARRAGWLGWSLILPVVLFWLWWITSANSTNYVFPPLERIVSSLRTQWFSADGLAQAWPSLRNFVLGYLAACALGVAIGGWLGRHAWSRDALLPVMDFLRSLPPPVLLPLGVLALGTGNEMKIVVICLGSIWPVIFGAMEGVRGLDPVRGSVTRVFRLSLFDRWRYVILPNAAPHVVAGMQAALQIAFVLIVISEFIASSTGIGFTILQASRTFRQADMWAGVIFLGLLGLFINLVFEVVKRWVLRWRIEESRLRLQQ
jgi:sulfonate transport system permease protein